MNRLERTDDAQAALLEVLSGWQAGIWTALPCIVESFNAVAMTLVLQPAVQARLTDSKGVQSWQELPLLLDVPVMFQGGGGFTATFPIVPGDEALAVFSSRCIDGWWQSGGVQVQPELRMHDLSDGFAFVGVRSKPRVLSGISTSSAQLRSDDGLSYVEVAAGHVVNIVAPGGINMTTAGAITMHAATLTATVVGDVTFDAPLVRAQHDIIDRYPTNPHTLWGSFTRLQEIYDEHTHGNVANGDDRTDPPEPLLDWWPV